VDIVSEAAAQRLVTMKAAIAVVEDVFRALHENEAEVFPVVLGHGSDPSSSFGMKSGLIRSLGLVGLKVGTYWPANRAKGIKSHGSTTLFLDDETGAPRALVSASYLTALRTAAADGVAVKHLSRPDAKTLALIGAGHQAWYELLAIREVRPIEQVYVWNRSPAAAEAFAARITSTLGLRAESTTAERATRSADIVVTVTAARQALVDDAWVRPGTHVSAMGADARGKQELDPAIFKRAHAFADVVEQAVTIGECQHAVASGILARNAITAIGAVIAGASPGRRSRDQITVFDSSGMALQDLAIGALALREAQKAGDVQTATLS
jgi:alanine dehydrogenase